MSNQGKEHLKFKKKKLFIFFITLNFNFKLLYHVIL